MYKLGKKPAKFDARNLKLRTILKALPPIPESWDVDLACDKPVPTPMFANDRWGDCVIAGRAHQTLRFEEFEQDCILPITEDDVLRQYWQEGQRGCALARWLLPRPDNGLVLLDSLRKWRRDGWEVAGKQYNVYAFAQVERVVYPDVRAAIYLLRGLNCGIMLPKSAQGQFAEDKPWSVVAGPDGTVGSWGGHCVYVGAYSPEGLTCVTWGKKQLMTWEFWDRYCDEAYAIVDNRNRFTENSPVDVELLDGYLSQL